MNPNFNQPQGYNYNLNYLNNQIVQDQNNSFSSAMSNPYNNINMYNPNIQMYGNYIYNPNNQPINNPQTITHPLATQQNQIESNQVNQPKINQNVRQSYDRRISDPKSAPHYLFLKSTEKPTKAKTDKIENMTPKYPNQEKLINDLHIKKVEHQVNIINQGKIKEYKIMPKEINKENKLVIEKQHQQIEKEPKESNKKHNLVSSTNDPHKMKKDEKIDTFKKSKTYDEKKDDNSDEYHFITPGENLLEDSKEIKTEQKIIEKFENEIFSKIEEKNESFEKNDSIEKLNLINNEIKEKEEKYNQEDDIDSPFKLMLQSQGEIQASIILDPEKKDNLMEEINQDNLEPLEIFNLKKEFSPYNENAKNKKIQEKIKVKENKHEAKDTIENSVQIILAASTLKLENENNENKVESQEVPKSGSHSNELIPEIKINQIPKPSEHEVKFPNNSYKVPDIRKLDSQVEAEEPFFPKENEIEDEEGEEKEREENESKKNQQILISSTISFNKGSIKQNPEKLPVISPIINPINIGLCNDAHSSLLRYYCPSKSLAICEACSKIFKEQGLGILPIKDYIINYGERLHSLISSVNKIFTETALNRNQSTINEQILNDIEYKFDEYIDQLQKCKLLLKSIVKREMNELQKNQSEETILQIIERLKSQSNEYNNAMLSGKFVEVLSMIDNDYLEKQKKLIQEIEKKPQNTGLTCQVKNVIHIPNTGLSTMLKQLGISLIDNELGSFAQELDPEPKLDEICWHNGSKLFTHNDNDKLITFSTNKFINADFKASIKIKKFSKRNSLSIGLSKVWLNLESGYIGLDLSGNQVGIMPNAIIGDRGDPIKLKKKQFELKEGDIVNIIMESNNVIFEVNSLRCEEYVCKNFKPPVFICGSLFNQGDQLEILKLEKLNLK